MELREEYKNSLNKLEFFENLSAEEKRNLYSTLSYSERRELLSSLPLQKLKEFVDSYSKYERIDIYQNLSDTVLKQLYKSSSVSEKEEMIKILENKQIKLNDEVEMARSSMSDSVSNINQANQSIETSKNNIVANKENIKQKNQELKEKKVVLKKLDKERKKNLKKVLRAKKKLSSPLNRIGIISKYRTNKYLEKVENLQQTYQAIDTQKMENSKIYQDIKNLEHAIDKEKDNIERQKQKITEEQRNINLNVIKLKTTEAQIKKLSNAEKKAIGRKLYNRVVSERDCIMVCKKQQTRKFEQQQKLEPKIEKVEPSQIEVVEPQKNNTENMVNNMINNTNKLQEMGVNFYPPANPITTPPNPEILSQPVTQISNEQLIIMMYTMAAFYNYTVQQMLQQQQAQNLNNDQDSDLSPKSRGNINLALLASIIFFTLGLLFFIMK